MTVVDVGNGDALGAICNYKSKTNYKSNTALTHTHTHTQPFNGPFSGTIRVSQYIKVKPIWISLKQETVSGSGISWAASLHLAPYR